MDRESPGIREFSYGRYFLWADSEESYKKSVSFEYLVGYLIGRPMKFNISSCLIVGAAFAAGIAVDRAVFPPVEDTAAVEGARVRNKESSSLSSRGSRSRTMSSQSGRSDSDRQLQESREEGAEGVLGSFRDAMEKLQDGGSMDAKTASQLLQSFPPGRERRHMLEHLANVWGRRNGQVAIEWAESLEGSDRRRALHSALHGWSEEDPAGAAQYVAELPTSEQNLHLVHEMAHRWAESDRTCGDGMGSVSRGCRDTQPGDGWGRKFMGRDGSCCRR